MKTSHQQALANINEAIAGGVEPEWENQIAAVIKYLSETEGEITNLRTDIDFAALVERHTNVKISLDVSRACLDIATA